MTRSSHWFHPIYILYHSPPLLIPTDKNLNLKTDIRSNLAITDFIKQLNPFLLILKHHIFFGLHMKFWENHSCEITAELSPGVINAIRICDVRNLVRLLRLFSYVRTTVGRYLVRSPLRDKTADLSRCVVGSLQRSKLPPLPAPLPTPLSNVHPVPSATLDWL